MTTNAMEMRTNGKAQKLDHQALQMLELVYVLETEKPSVKSTQKAGPGPYSCGRWEFTTQTNASRESLDWGYWVQTDGDGYNQALREGLHSPWRRFLSPFPCPAPRIPAAWSPS